MNTERTLPTEETPSPSSPFGETVSRTVPGVAWWLPFVGLVVALLCTPFFRVIFWTGDEGVLLDGAQRILQGERLYADFFEALPPGGLLFTAAWLGTVGLSFWSARLLALLTLVGIACFTHLACLRASKNAPLSAFLAIGCIGIPVSQTSLSMMTINHHWFTTLFSMVAVWAGLTSVERPAHSRRWPLISGIAGGMAAMVVPTCGSLAALAGASAFSNLHNHRTEMGAYVAGVLVIPLGLLAYVIGNHLFTAAFDDVILFPFYRYSSIQGVPFATWANGVTRPLKYLYPLTGLLAAIVYVRGWQSRPDRPLRLCVAFAVAGLIASYPRPDIFHIIFTAPLACPLLACCADRIGRRVRPRYRAIAVGAVLLLCVPAARSYWVDQMKALHAGRVPTPRGDTVFLGQRGTPEILARIAQTPSADRYFFYPYMPMMPFLTARAQVSQVDLFTPEFTMPSQYLDACVSVMRQATWVVIDRRWTDPRWLKRIFPSMRNPRPEETVRFEYALDSAFDLVGTDDTFELRHRRSDASEALCTGIAG